MDDRLIANIIYRELFSYKALFLHDIGFLSLVSHPAALSKNGSSLRPPYSTVAVFPVQDSKFDSFVDLVMAISLACSIDYTAAYQAYSDYISRNQNGDVLILPYVMSISMRALSIVEVDETLRAVLESQDMDSVAVPNRTPAQLPAYSANAQSCHANVYHQSRKPGKYSLSSGPGAFMLALSITIVTAAFMFVLYYFFGETVLQNFGL